MSDEHWYRNTAWKPEIEAAFDAKLARSRSQKAQYLRIQGSILKEAHPTAALKLLQRCIEMDDEFHLAHAHLDSAYAHYVMSDIEATLRSLEAAMEAQLRSPMFQTSAPFDYCMLVALHNREERYDTALTILENLTSGPFPVTDFQGQAARALILWERGRQDEARDAADKALAAASVDEGDIPGFPEVGVVPSLDNRLGERVAEIAASRN
jgi:tetratricopeptide (TPR) repeat protein